MSALSMTSLDDSVRGVVRDELVRAGVVQAPVRPATPTRTDLLLLVVLAADIALVLLVIPYANNSAVEKFLTVVQWVGTTVFVAAATWFQEKFLEFSRTKAFRVVAFGVLALLLPQKVPLIPIHVPRPAEAMQLTLDGDRLPPGVSGRRMVTISSHTLQAVASGQQCAVGDQPAVSLRWTELPSAVREAPIVDLYYDVSASFPASVKIDTVVRLARRDRAWREHDTAVLDQSLIDAKAGTRQASEDGGVGILYPAGFGAASLRLPNGDYILELTTTDGTCLARACGRLATLLDTNCTVKVATSMCAATPICR